MAVSKKLYIAESAFVAFVDRNHPKHKQASAYFRYFAQERYNLCTGYLTIIEAYKIIFDEISQSLARDFLRAITTGNINVLYPTESDIKATIKVLVSSQSNELDFKNAQMEVFAYRNNINQILTFDFLPPLFGLVSFSLPI